MDGAPQVSAITIFLNAEKFLQEAIESVFAQTFDNWELLLVDDGSTDRGTEIAKSFSTRFPGKVKYLEHKGHRNLGMSASRNHGIHSARGEFIAFLDADDAWLSHKLEEQISILDSKPAAAMVWGKELVWYGWTGDPHDLERDFISEFFGVEKDSVIPPPMLIPLFLRYGVTPSPSVIMVRRNAALKVGGFEESFRHMYEDEAFYGKICLNSPVYVSTQCWIKRRKHADACTSVREKIGESDSDRLNFLEWYERYLEQLGFRGSEVWEALQEQLWTYRCCSEARLRRSWAWKKKDWVEALRRASLMTGRMFRGKSTGQITANPPLVQFRDLSARTATLSWVAKKTDSVEIRVGAPYGLLLCRAGASGNAAVGNWVNNGMIFFLQDAAGGEPGSAAQTLDWVRIGVLHSGNRGE